MTLKTVEQRYGKREKVTAEYADDGRTHQSFKDECDINSILTRYQRTGMIEHVNKRRPVYGDVTSMDFKEAMDTVRRTEELFSELPSNVREYFNQDPGQFLDWAQDPQNAETLSEIASGDFDGKGAEVTQTEKSPENASPRLSIPNEGPLDPLPESGTTGVEKDAG